MGTDDTQSLPRPVRRRDLRAQRQDGAQTARPLASLFAATLPADPQEFDGTPVDAPVILVVCTGNICRSPLAELLLRARLAPLGLLVHSAGTRAIADKGMPREARRVARDWGIAESDAAAHRSRALTDAMIARADLTLTMTVDHRTEAIGRVPGALRRVFTLREFASLTQQVEIGMGPESVTSARARLAQAVDRIADQRGAHDPGNLDVIDPYGQPAAVYDQSARELGPAVDRVVAVVQAAMSTPRQAHR